MADNLTISIGADSSKLRADLALAQSGLKQFGKELRTAADEARKTGDTQHLQAASRRYQELEGRVRALRRELSQQTPAINNQIKAMGGLSTAVAGVGTALTALRGLLPAAGAAAAVYELGRAFSNVTKNLTELRNVSAATGGAFSPQDVKVFQEVLQGAGVSTDLARQALTRFSDSLAEARQKAGAQSGGAAHSVNVLRGALGNAGAAVKVFRGGIEEVKDIKKPFEAASVDVKNLGKGAQVGSTALIKFAKGLVDLKKTDPLTAMSVGMEVFGKQWSQLAIGIERLAASGAWAKIEAQLIKSGRGISPEDLARLEAYEAAWDELGDAIESVIQPLVISLFPLLSEILTKIAADTTAFKEALVILGRDATQVWTDFSTFMVNMWMPIQNAATATFDWIVSKARAAAAAIASILPGGGSAVAAEAPIPGRAAGGLIRGPGSGTSDSILARLSNGEFVMRARAVDHWGPRFLAALNSLQNPFGYAGGGLVRAPRFATGGMVQARMGDGTVVNLHFPGGTFALRADREIVGGLTREARRAGMLSAGRMAAAIA